MMTSEVTGTESSVKKSVTVRAPIAHAFSVFTKRVDLWWPKDHRLGKTPFTAVVMEDREGGRWYEKGADGNECDWGRVLSITPPKKVLLAWHIDTTWTFDPDPSRASRVEVTFHDLSDGTTRVDLVHSELERHGGDWQKYRESFADGWTGVMEGYASAANAAAS